MSDYFRIPLSRPIAPKIVDESIDEDILNIQKNMSRKCMTSGVSVRSCSTIDQSMRSDSQISIANCPLFIMDWDDTFAPTSWLVTEIPSFCNFEINMPYLNLFSCIAVDPPTDSSDVSWARYSRRTKIPSVSREDHIIVQKLESVAIAAAGFLKHLLKVGGDFSRIAIITNAEPGWVEASSVRFLPRLANVLAPLLHSGKVQVISARATAPSDCSDPTKWKVFAFDRVISKFLENSVITFVKNNHQMLFNNQSSPFLSFNSSFSASSSPSAPTTSASSISSPSLPHISSFSSSSKSTFQLGPFGINASTSPPSTAMIAEWLSNSEHQTTVARYVKAQIFSFGDAAHEREAIKSRGPVASPTWVPRLVKSIKFLESPSPTHLLWQHTFLQQCVEELLGRSQSFDLCVKQKQPLLNATSSSDSSNSSVPHHSSPLTNSPSPTNNSSNSSTTNQKNNSHLSNKMKNNRASCDSSSASSTSSNGSVRSVQYFPNQSPNSPNYSVLNHNIPLAGVGGSNLKINRSQISNPVVRRNDDHSCVDNSQNINTVSFYSRR